MTFSLLDTLIEGGNAAARFRRQELGRLHDMLRLLRQRDYRASLSSCPVVDEPLAPQNGVNAQGISPNEMLNVASLLDDYPPLDFDSDVVNSWLWEAGNPAGHVEGAGERV